MFEKLCRFYLTVTLVAGAVLVPLAIIGLISYANNAVNGTFIEQPTK